MKPRVTDEAPLGLSVLAQRVGLPLLLVGLSLLLVLLLVLTPPAPLVPPRWSGVGSGPGPARCQQSLLVHRQHRFATPVAR